MANASYVQDSFIGGEKSQLAQGRITDREYRTWMNVCVNGHPTEAGGWIRRPGTMHAGLTRQGGQARVIKFDFSAATPYTMEFTNRVIRFRSGLNIATTNDSQFVTAISAANPAVVTTLQPHGWVSTNAILFTNLGATLPLLQNRQFFINVINNLQFSIFDGITGAPINGATLGAFSTGTVSRIQELISPYFGFSWLTLRSIQAENNAILLQGTIAPQLITATPPSGSLNATFSISGLTFLDGPYLDPFSNGAQAVPGGTSGNVTLTIQFPTWLSTKAYKTGDFVTLSAINYQSLFDNNVGYNPASSPTAWAVVSAGAAINNGQGFLSTDIGRLVRLFSEPTIWNATATYNVGSIVSYNPSGAPGASTYWTSLVNTNIGHIPGTDTTNWQLTPSNAAIWSWGRITSIANLISPTLAGSAAIGTLIFSGGLNAAFDGNTSKNAALCAGNEHVNGTSASDYIGKNYSGATPQVIGEVSIFPSADIGFINSQFTDILGNPHTDVVNFSFNLRGNQTSPGSPSDGTLLGSSPVLVNGSTPTGEIFTPSTQNFTAVSIASNDQVTSWKYVWIEILLSTPLNEWDKVDIDISQLQFFSPIATVPISVNLEILGPPLLYTNPCITWRLGAYSGTTGWPTNGTYHEGRVWLAGAIGNRFDASVSNGLSGTTLNFAPTDQNGTVGAANGISGVVNSDGVNPILWMQPDLQGIIMGTLAGEWLISAPSTGPLSATNIFAHRVTKIGCAFIEPRRSDHTIVFVQRYSKKVMEYFTDVYSGKFAAPNLAKDTMHITKPTVAELAYTNATTPIVWGRNNDGSWWGATYKRDTLATSTGPTINGWHRHTLGSGRSVQSIAAGPSVGGTLDALTMVTLDVSTGIYHVEVMTDAVEEGDTLVQATYLDDAVNPTSTSQVAATPAMPFGGITLNGLWHLNGKKVTAWLGGLDCGDYTVANGSITVPYGDGISAGTAQGLFAAGYAAMLSLSQMLVGFTYNSQGQIVRPATPAESGARNGPAVGKVRRNHKIAAQLEGTGTQVSFGYGFQSGQRNQAKFRQLNDVALLQNQQFTGVYKDTLTDPYSFDGMIAWQVIRPYPLNIANIGGFIETSDE